MGRAARQDLARRADRLARHGARRRQSAVPRSRHRAVQGHDQGHAHGHARPRLVQGALRHVGRPRTVLLPRRRHGRAHDAARARHGAGVHDGAGAGARAVAGRRVPDHQHSPRRRRGRAARAHLPAARRPRAVRRDRTADLRRRRRRQLQATPRLRNRPRDALLRPRRDGHRHARPGSAPRRRVVAPRVPRHPREDPRKRLRQLPQASLRLQAREVPHAPAGLARRQQGRRDGELRLGPQVGRQTTAATAALVRARFGAAHHPSSCFVSALLLLLLLLRCASPATPRRWVCDEVGRSSLPLVVVDGGLSSRTSIASLRCVVLCARRWPSLRARSFFFFRVEPFGSRGIGAIRPPARLASRSTRHLRPIQCVCCLLSCSE
mmetsp:Transcript_26365/g.105535  ORF Transcript_26365/g.105535 Transcript_26365/m.105535 type:complete len:379 (+) Transcript_26365:681-1817(+)